MSGEQPYADQLRALQRDYAARLPHRCAELEARAAALAARWDGAAAEELRRLAHNLAGSGASYGLPAVSGAARAVERALDALLARAAPTAAAELEPLESALRALRATVAAAPAD